MKSMQMFKTFQNYVITLFAFTLAETLIVLGIIGVVASLTLPTLVTKYQKFVTVTRLKYAYSVLYQAISKAEAQHGDLSEWNWQNRYQTDMFDEYIKPNIKNIRKDTMVKNGTLGITYKRISGTPENSLAIMGNGGTRGTTIYSLPNGTQIFVGIYGSSNRKMSLLIDINGFKFPNQFGKDVFMFTLTPEHKLYPMGLFSSSECSFPNEPNSDRNLLKNGSCLSYECNKNARGMWCGALIMVDGWKISDDYPW